MPAELIIYLLKISIKLNFISFVLVGVGGTFTVNGLDLETDIMRYDKPNKITGIKTFRNLEVDVLSFEKNIKIQDVDIMDFVTNAVLKNGNFRITGDLAISSATFENGLR